MSDEERPVGLSFLELNSLSIDVLKHSFALILRFRLDFEIFRVREAGGRVWATARRRPPQ